MVGPDIPGRKIMVVGDSLDSSPVLDLAKNATAIIHSASSEVGQSYICKTLDSLHISPNNF